ncbi:MAG: hypothetical protein FJZ12_01585, partial [Candidatus Omnitrophica bacterium]|nr:hypothetical protein [Candidatus Omnitrophota bacterium]
MRLLKSKRTIQRRFILVESDGLVLETIQTYNRQYSRQQLRLLKLKGSWRANEYNELVFEAAGRKGKSCEWKENAKKYTFKGGWKLNNNQQIEYTTGSGRDTLTFKGHWQILSAKKLVYVLEGSSKSRFEFKAHLESASMRPKKGEIRYRIGIGVRQ